MSQKLICDYCGSELDESERAVVRIDRTVGGSAELHFHDQAGAVPSCYSEFELQMSNIKGERPASSSSPAQQASPEA